MKNWLQKIMLNMVERQQVAKKKKNLRRGNTFKVRNHFANICKMNMCLCVYVSVSIYYYFFFHFCLTRIIAGFFYIKSFFKSIEYMAPPLMIPYWQKHSHKRLCELVRDERKPVSSNWFPFHIVIVRNTHATGGFLYFNIVMLINLVSKAVFGCEAVVLSESIR